MDEWPRGTELGAHHYNLDDPFWGFGVMTDGEYGWSGSMFLCVWKITLPSPSASLAMGKGEEKIMWGCV